MTISKDLANTIEKVRWAYEARVKGFPLCLNDTVILKWEVDGLKGNNLDLKLNVLALLHALLFGRDKFVSWKNAFPSQFGLMGREGHVVIRGANLDMVGEVFLELNEAFASAFPAIHFDTLQRVMSPLVGMIMDDILAEITSGYATDQAVMDGLVDEFSKDANDEIYLQAADIAMDFMNAIGESVRSPVFQKND